MLRMWSRRLVGVILLAGAGLLVLEIATREAAFQPDFRVYYCAARAYEEGLNPYDPESLSRVANAPPSHPYVYPLLVLVPFKFIPPLSDHNAYRLFLLIKCLILVGLLFLWRKILRPVPGIVFYVFCLLAFNGTLYLDFLSGNVSVIEQGALWLSFLFFARGNLLLFCLFVLVGSSFKITPLLFLLLLWSADDRRRHWYFFGSLACFVVAHGAAFLVHAGLFPAFLQNVQRFEETGIVNPSTANLLKSLSMLISRTTGYEVPAAVRWTVFGGIVVAIIAVSRRAYAAARRLPHDERVWQTVFLACFVYALVLPRFKDYSFILLLVPAFSVIRRASPAAAQTGLIILAALSAHYGHFPVFRRVLDLLWDYYPLALAYLFWGMQVRDLVTRPAGVGTRPRTVGAEENVDHGQ
jgi:Glycosyltransferase family 87